MPKPAAWRLANGRALPPLLFVTCQTKLALKIGPDAALICAEIGKMSTLLDLSAAQTVSVGAVATAIRPRLNPGIKGVVLIGGYEVIPAQIVDTIASPLTASVARGNDADDFYVWSDDVYGRGPNDGDVPGFPVSRIPDAGSATLVWTSLGVGELGNTTGRGLRNIRRPFADPIYNTIPGAAPVPMPTSIPTTSPLAPGALGGDNVYLMLHGSDSIGASYWGEGGPTGMPVAVRATDIAASENSVVFTGCCWAALVTTNMASSGAAIASKSIAQSIALTFLAKGARAFLGCSGSHYSPVNPPYSYNGGPLHEAFWRRFLAGEAPAAALRNAKYVDYAPGIPHLTPDPLAIAIERKVMLEYMCLGLGW